MCCYSRKRQSSRNSGSFIERSGARFLVNEIAFYEKVIKVKADVAAFLINCFPSA
jgi:hypothetical protein